jgi:hypothetical protein
VDKPKGMRDTDGDVKLVNETKCKAYPVIHSQGSKSQSPILPGSNKERLPLISVTLSISEMH